MVVEKNIYVLQVIGCTIFGRLLGGKTMILPGPFEVVVAWVVSVHQLHKVVREIQDVKNHCMDYELPWLCAYSFSGEGIVDS